MTKIISFLLLTSIFPLIALADGASHGDVGAMLEIVGAFFLFLVLVFIYCLHIVFSYRKTNPDTNINTSRTKYFAIIFLTFLSLMVNHADNSVIYSFDEYTYIMSVIVVLVPIFVYFVSPRQRRIQNTKIAAALLFMLIMLSIVLDLIPGVVQFLEITNKN